MEAGKIKYIYLKQNEDVSELIDSLVKEFEIEIIYLHDISNISDIERSSRVDYLTLMNDNIELLKNELYD
jgi:ABC-type Zn uptake system ZnuABC Zn-binding protein ZnuA